MGFLIIVQAGIIVYIDGIIAVCRHNIHTSQKLRKPTKAKGQHIFHGWTNFGQSHNFKIYSGWLIPNQSVIFISEENKGGFINKYDLVLDFSNKWILRYLTRKFVLFCPTLSSFCPTQKLGGAILDSDKQSWNISELFICKLFSIIQEKIIVWKYFSSLF